MNCYECNGSEACIAVSPRRGNKYLTYTFYFCKDCAIKIGMINKEKLERKKGVKHERGR